MGDIYCAKCGEPWDSYGILYAVGEDALTHYEAMRFRKGEGCPACNFGATCPNCYGTGHINCRKEPPVPDCTNCKEDCAECLHLSGETSCSQCFGHGYVTAYHLPGDPVWHERFNKDVIYGTDVVKVVDKEERHESKDGPFWVGVIICPRCHAYGSICPECGGDGKLHQKNDEDTSIAGFSSMLEESDDPDSIIADWQ